jgi:hypothetical protein
MFKNMKTLTMYTLAVTCFLGVMGQLALDPISAGFSLPGDEALRNTHTVTGERNNLPERTFAGYLWESRTGSGLRETLPPTKDIDNYYWDPRTTTTLGLPAIDTMIAGYLWDSRSEQGYQADPPGSLILDNYYWDPKTTTTLGLPSPDLMVAGYLWDSRSEQGYQAEGAGTILDNYYWDPRTTTTQNLPSPDLMVAGYTWDDRDGGNGLVEIDQRVAGYTWDDRDGGHGLAEFETGRRIHMGRPRWWQWAH